jgi:hypothetical protein
MKKINTLYWISTSLFGGFMMFSAVPDIMIVPDAIEFISNKLGYPQYIIVFLGVAKALGVIAIFLPGNQRIKEWAYAGLCFDLIGATYSNLCVDGLQPGLAFMLLPFSIGALSYIYYHKRMNTAVN